LAEANTLLDWENFRPIGNGVYDNKTKRGGHPNIDFVLMIKILVLQHWFGLSDQEIERQLANNLSSMNFLSYPKTFQTPQPYGSFVNVLRRKPHDLRLMPEG